jgi:hypothetical protein
MTKEERVFATTSSPDLSEVMIDDTVHRSDPEMETSSEDEMMVWAYLMTQYNLKPG